MNYSFFSVKAIGLRGINKRKEIQPQIPFILTYCDQIPEINIIHFLHPNILQRSYPRKAQLVCATKENKSLKDS